MNSLCGQTNNPIMQTGMIPYGAPVPGAGGGDSLFQIAWRGKWLILLSAVLGLGGAYGYFRTIKPEYASSSRVLVEKPRTTPGPVDILQPGTTAANYLPQQASILLSREILGAAMSDPNVLAISTFSVAGRLQAVVQTLSAKVGKDDIITVSGSSPDPNEAAVVVNAVVRAFKRWHEANKQLSTAELLKDLNAQLDRSMKDLARKRQEMVLLEQRNPSILENTRGGIVSKTLDALKQEVATARLYAIQQESYYDRLVHLESDPNRLRQHVLGQGFGADDGERARLVDTLYTTQLQLKELKAGGMTVQKSQVTRLENTEKELGQRIADFDKKFVQEHIALAGDLKEDAKVREQKLTKLYEEEYAKLQQAGGQDSAYELKKSECQLLENLCNTLLSKINSLDLNARLEGLSIHVLEEAVPGRQAPSQMARTMGMGLILGLMMGGGLAFVRDLRDHRVRSADEITAILGVPILGAVPTISRGRLFFRRSKAQFVAGSRESESFRSIRTALFFGPTNGGAKTLLVTSPGPLEGKTTLVSNLAIAMAHAGQKTLILDADLRKPMMHRVFAQGGQGRGLVDVLTGMATLGEVVRPTDVEGLDVLESGRPARNPSELLSSDAFAAVLEQLKSRYDRILVDSPPVGVVADAQVLAARCGLTLLVLRAQKTSRIFTQRARDALSTVSAKVVGAVVNDVARGDTRYSHYGYGAYSSYHGALGLNGQETIQGELPASTHPKPPSEASAPQER